MTRYIGRFAPAPTGAMHLGNARTFLAAWLRANHFGGYNILRLEDLDHPKVKLNADRELYADLRWLGLDWKEGPHASYLLDITELDTSSDNYIQSCNLPLYRQALSTLNNGGRCYPCICSRKELVTVASAPNAGEDTKEKRYPGTCRDRFATYGEALAAANGKEPGWRFRVDDAETRFVDLFHGEQFSTLAAWSGDFLVARGDNAGYQLAVVVDDARMGISEVVRGDDLLPSTHRQLALYRALDLRPPAFCHLPLVVGPDGRRLAKRHGDSRLSRLRLGGKDPSRVLGWLAWSFGWSDSFRNEMTLADLVRRYDFSAIPRAPVVVTREHLEWMGFP